jgi:tRNA (guanine-N7-)-methyltransferase
MRIIFAPVAQYNKLERFAQMKTMPNVVQYHFGNLKQGFHPLRGNWAKDFFKNNNPVVLELGCGKGEYTVGLAKRFPEKNFIGVDIKGARMFIGAMQALEGKLGNAAFLRTRIDFINALFGPGEIDEIWITFPDPQKEKPRKRLTSPLFLKRYAHLLKPGGIINLKTDSVLMHEYTLGIIKEEGCTQLHASNDIYNTVKDPDHVLRTIQTTYEKRFLGMGMAITHVSFQLKEGYGMDEKIFPLTEIE